MSGDKNSFKLTDTEYYNKTGIDRKSSKIELLKGELFHCPKCNGIEWHIQQTRDTFYFSCVGCRYVREATRFWRSD